MDICKPMRADEELADIPVLFVSALEPGDLHRVAEEAGATNYLIKTVHMNDLLKLVGNNSKERKAELSESFAESA